MEDYFDNYFFDHIPDIHADEIDIYLIHLFPKEETVQTILENLINKTLPKKQMLKIIIDQIDIALDEKNKDKFFVWCKIYKNVQKEYW